MFNDGLLEIYRKIPSKGAGGKPVEVLEPYATSFYGELNFTANEYYAAQQAETLIAKRVRLPQDKNICNKHVIVIDGVQYEVGRVYSAAVKGVQVTDITLERVTTKYDIA
jgi:SPP1 family predicted phage head-tail adaptor